MKSIFFQWCILVIVLGCGMLTAPCGYAQTGWQWGISNVNNNNSGIDVKAATIDDSGNVIVTGRTGEETGPGIMDYMVFGTDTVYGTGSGRQIIAKADSNGRFLWATGFVCTPIDIVTDHSGNIYELGYYQDSRISIDTITLLNPGSYSMNFIAKYSPAGNVVWAKNIVGDAGYESIGTMGIDSAGNIYVAGGFDLPFVTIGDDTLINASPAGDTLDVFVAQYDSLGNVTWATSFGGRQDDWANAMTVTPGGNIYISGSFMSRSMAAGSGILTDSLLRGTYYESLPFLVKMDSSGDVIWAETQNSKLNIYQLAYDGLENIYMIGYMDSSVILGGDTLADFGGADVFLAKYDSSGSVVWADNIGGPLNDYGYSIALDNCNNVWIAGGTASSSGSELMNFSGHTITLTGGDPAFIAAYNDAGRYITSTTIISGGDDYLGIMADNRGNVYAGGDYMNSSPVIGPDTPGYTVSSFVDNEELLVAKYRYGPPCAVAADTLYEHTDTAICAVSDTIIVTLTAPAGTGYLWNDGATTGTHIVYMSGAYWVSYITGTNFITDTFYVTVTHSSPPCDAIAGVGGSPERSISVYPNPGATQLTVSSTQTPVTQVTITDLPGQAVYTGNYNAPLVQIDVSLLPPAVYFIKVNGSEVRKWVKE